MLKKIISALGYLLLMIGLGLTIRFLFLNTSSTDTSGVSTKAFFASHFLDSNAQSQALQQWKGKTVVLNFWATWCPPCREEMPEFSQLYRRYQDKNVVVLGLATEDIDTVRDYLKEAPVSYPILIGENEAIALSISLGNSKSALPYTVVIKPDGTIANNHFGRVSLSQLESMVNALQ